MISAVHPVEDRFFSVREFMHLMGMSSEFQIWGKEINHIAQNVRVCTAQDYAEEFIKFCYNSISKSSVKYLKQNNIKKTCQEMSPEIEEQNSK